MKLSGSYQINLSKEKVWEALNDPEILKKAIPGCEEFTKNSETEFTAKATNKIGPFNASFTGDVELKDLNPPNSYKITGSGNSPVGFASGEAFVKLEDHEQGTKLIYEVEANVGGKIAQVGSRLIDMTAKKMADIFFGKFSELISSTDEGNNKDQIDQKLTDQNNIKSKNQNKILIYSAVVVGALILAYFIL
ncbi:SRPBCC family protein [Candidatus Pelagibacter communis]|uniref:SRPBCC family protein n=1 Tax=Candidatus Pelagibacter TaxID=198251 RepID=UPI003EE01FC8